MSHAKIKVALAALLACSAFSASAASPFSDVDHNDWSYKAVAELSEQGVVDGYPDGSFKGNKEISRFETAQIVARLLAKENSLNNEQKASVHKLANAYSDELKQLGVRVDNVEKKLGKTALITEIRVSGMNRYDNIFKDKKKSHYEFGARVGFNTITKVNPRTTVYGQLETYMSLNGQPMYDVNADQHEDSKLHLGRLFVTHQFGKEETDPRSPMGPMSNIIGIGQFPVTMGVTGYTYKGNFKGAFIQFGDANKGGHLRLAYGRATDINYDYTAPMQRGIHNFDKTLAEINNSHDALAGIKGPRALQAKADAKEALINAVKAGKGTLYPLAPKVMMKDGEDADVPAAYASYIYKKPGKYEVHAYALKAVGPVSNIVQAYGTALSYNVTDKLNLHGEYVKNSVKLPLNNERPSSYTVGFTYGNASVLKPKSYSFGLDYIHSQAGTYFGGSSSDIADQYMAHVYKDWTPAYASTSLGKMPAYFADKFDNQLKAKTIEEIVKAKTTPSGGAKFFLAKAQYVPIKGLILEASYGFNATDMGGKQMDNIFRIQATAYIK
ncbi:MAG: S-layer homology domain-containing protein [Dialister micraerophilus]|uniref:S-layer homology domain-containing protein n=1 Tax=Dialister micraerophilus TaxID=309120 RepID=UPI00254C6CFF|nr:S-layer homology domain-containing protein [Dialister micraerophilus]MDK8252974.1 S-layer homology domain-containing protein [Dialister micraerophilus]